MIYINTVSYIKPLLTNKCSANSFHTKLVNEHLFNAFLLSERIPFLIVGYGVRHVCYYIANTNSTLIEYAYNKLRNSNG